MRAPAPAPTRHPHSPSRHPNGDRRPADFHQRAAALPETTTIIKRLTGKQVVHRARDQYAREADSDGCFHGPPLFTKDNFRVYDPVLLRSKSETPESNYIVFSTV